jgi:pimeloyl-ACP methyl ester carboxylesterase
MPGSRLAVIEASGHCPHMSHPADTVREIRRFLEG